MDADRQSKRIAERQSTFKLCLGDTAENYLLFPPDKHAFATGKLAAHRMSIATKRDPSGQPERL